MDYDCVNKTSCSHLALKYYRRMALIASTISIVNLVILAIVLAYVINEIHLKLPGERSRLDKLEQNLQLLSDQLKAFTGGYDAHYNGSFFTLHTDLKTWDESLSSCLGQGGRLAVLNSTGKQSVVWEQIKQDASERYVWIAGRRLSDDRYDFYWMLQTDWKTNQESRIKFTDSHWLGEEPYNSGGNENCVHFMANGTWVDADCNSRRGYLCERRQLTQ